MHQHPIFHIYWNQRQAIMEKTNQGEKIQFESRSISELSLKLETCEKGNEVWLTISNGVELEDLKQFVQQFKNVICKMEFWADGVKRISPCELQQLLCGLPNLSHLRFHGIPSEWKRRNEKLALSILLPQVQTVSFRYLSMCPDVDPTLIEGLLQTMPNLKNVHHFPLRYIDILKVDGMINLSSIKSVDVLNPFELGREMGKKLSQLASLSSKTRLQMAQLRFGAWPPENMPDFEIWKSCCESWSSIFRNNKNTLEYLIITPFSHPELLDYPEMKAVKKLHLFSKLPSQKSDGQKTQFFGEGFDFGKAFPNLMEVTLQSSACSLEDFLGLFPEDAIISNNVKGVTSLSLEFDFYGDPKTMEKVAALFPNVTSFFTKSRIRWMEVYLPHILRLWPNLRSLKLKVDVTAPECNEKSFEKYLLDPVFTGISAEKCSKFRDNPEKMNIDLKNYQEKSGISTMTELEELTLIFHSYYQNKGVQEGTLLFSHVTPFYGFQCLPDLKVTCAISCSDKNSDKIREMLSPIEKHVNFNPNYYEERELSDPDSIWY